MRVERSWTDCKDARVRWADSYSYKANDGVLKTVVRPAVLARGYLEREEFLEVCEWKTKRSKSRCSQNNEFTIRTISRAAFATSDERLKMDLLRTLSGVEWPTASTLLHFCDKRPYPILDYRALWSLGYDKRPHYTMDFWLEYLCIYSTTRQADLTGHPNSRPSAMAIL